MCGGACRAPRLWGRPASRTVRSPRRLCNESRVRQEDVLRSTGRGEFRLPTPRADMTEVDSEGRNSVSLIWLPVGAGGHVVKHTSAWWERACAFVERRRPATLFHAALELCVDGVPYVVEMAPAWAVTSGERGVVATGPVGARWLGRSRYFRYEVRCWAHGVIPDREFAWTSSVVVTVDKAAVARVLCTVSDVAPLTWGRRATGASEMWNSNSLVSWVLARSGLSTSHLLPPGGRAPGWRAGCEVAEQDRHRPV
ncbi:hypothetical protein OERS_04620 [Oerskovia enterophila]|uniref:Uncharacterized protein n=1 Tax=Oerskovia enterophila TaxID=43678 RepID=A0ABX2Y8Q4_9CELL|nr:hypothetical protein OERS_04620 [Oerskovia enterophila]